VPPLDVRCVLCRVVWSVFLVALNFQFHSLFGVYAERLFFLGAARI
jgi:hypothetical protein